MPTPMVMYFEEAVWEDVLLKMYSTQNPSTSSDVAHIYKHKK